MEENIRTQEEISLGDIFRILLRKIKVLVLALVIGAVVGATYPKMGKALRRIMPKSYILVPGYGAQGGKGKDLVHFFNKDGLGAIVNSSRGIIAAYKSAPYSHKYSPEDFADASRAAVKAMKKDIREAIG